MTVITTLKGEQVHGMTANAFMSVSLEPPLVLSPWTAGPRCADMLHEGSHYGVSVLCETQSALSDRFAGRPGDDLPEPRFDARARDAAGRRRAGPLRGPVQRSYWGGDHSLFLGRVEYARHHSGSPLLFHGGRYERLGQDSIGRRISGRVRGTFTVNNTVNVTGMP